MNQRDNEFRLKLLSQMPKNSICAEIGVWKGEFSELILNTIFPKKLHLIDPWEFQSEFSERMYGGAVSKNQKDMDLIYEDVKERFNNYSNIIFNRGKSEKVLNEFENKYFDWVYIDGNHYYEYVLKDLQLSLLKVKSSGFIAGDDYTWGKNKGFPVKMAVQNFIKEKNLESNLKVMGSQFIIKL